MRTILGPYSLAHLALGCLWLLIGIAGIIACIRTRSFAILLQALGAFLLFINAVFSGLIFNFLFRLFVPNPDIEGIQLFHLLTYAPGIILFACGYSMEKFRQRSPNAARAFPMEIPGTPRNR